MLSAAGMHGESMEVLEEDMIKIGLEEGALSAAGMDVESMEVLEEDRIEIRVEEGALLAAGKVMYYRMVSTGSSSLCRSCALQGAIEIQQFEELLVIYLDKRVAKEWGSSWGMGYKFPYGKDESKP